MIRRLRWWWKEGHPIVLYIIPDRWCRVEGIGGELNWLGKAVNAYYSWTLWLRWSWWWGFVLRPRDDTTWGSWLATVWCRLRGHPGEIYWNPGGLEPDHRCKRCGETIG